MNTKSSIFKSVEDKSENITFGVHERNKNRFYTEKVFFLFLLCFKIALKQFIPVHQPSGQKLNVFPSLSASNLMLPASMV